MPRPCPILPLLLAVLALAGLARPAGAFTPAEAKAPMTVTLVRSDAPDCGPDCPEWLALTGVIGFDTPPRLAAALARLGKRRVPILLDSPGGETRAGLAMGRMIRAHGFDTVVSSTTLSSCDEADRACQDRLRAGERPGHVGPPFGTSLQGACASACVFLLAGGVDRSVPPATAVGVHQTKQILTYHPVMNMFRVLSRTVNGRKVEVSRTLVSTRALPVRVVTGAAPQSLYSEFDRFLLGLGVDESIMPLMRSTPPSGILWLTRTQLGSTRIANDTTDAATLVGREAAAQATAARREVQLSAALTLNDGRRWKGSVTWRIDPSVPATPALVGDWEVPERHLRGSVAITADPAPWSPTSFRILTRFDAGTGADAASIWKAEQPRLCDDTQCVNEIAGDTAYGRPAAATFGVVKRWNAFLLRDLRQRAWLRIFVRTAEGLGTIDLPLASPDANAVTAWEKLCCGFDATEVPLAMPAAALPAFPERPEPPLVGGIRPVQPAAGAPKPLPRTLDMQALYDAAPMRQHGFPAAVRGTVAWTPPAAPPARGTGTAVLLGTAELPAAGLRVTMEAGASEHGVLGRLTVRLHVATDDPSRFGPVSRIVAMHSYDPEEHPLLLVDHVDASANAATDEIHLDVPETGPIAGAFQLGLEDAQGRRVTLAIPFDPAVAALLQGAARRGPAGDG